jgi:hypothetical protein
MSAGRRGRRAALRARGLQAPGARLDQLLRQHPAGRCSRPRCGAPVPARNLEAEIAGVIGEFEMVAWMAMHRTREHIAQPFDTATARQACIAVACGGLLGSAAVAR